MRGAARGTRRSPAASQVKSQPDASRVDGHGANGGSGRAHGAWVAHVSSTEKSHTSGLSGAGVGAGVLKVGARVCAPMLADTRIVMEY